MFNSKFLRWVLLTLGLFAILALTGMNVYSLYDIRDRMVENEEERQLALLEDLVDDVRREFYIPFRGFESLEMEPIERAISESGTFPPQIHEKIINAAQHPLFSGIYYTPEGTDPCEQNTSIYIYNYERSEMQYRDDYPSAICDGVGLARTKARIELNSFDYRWNSNTEFDAHRSMNIGFINTKENRIIGYLTVTLNRDYLIDELIAPRLTDYFNPEKNPGTVVWLHDWANDVVLATNNETVPFDRDLVDARRGFIYQNMMENWNIKIAFLNNPVASAYNNTLFKILFVLGVAVLFLVGALLFMFYTAQRERSLYQRQTGFLANVTHELKTPLAVMQAAGENIHDGRVTEPERLKQYGSHIYNESIRLRNMIEKLLDVAKTDSGQTLIKAVPVQADSLVKDYLDENIHYIKSKGFEIETDYSGSNDLIMVDPDNIHTVLSNLSENAIKYCSDRKRIRYSVTQQHKEICISVQDEGICIPRKHLRNIFKKFYRVEDSLNARTKGHGLGLSIVKSLIELNGGSIDVQSDVGKGTTFTVKFPIFVRQSDSSNETSGDVSESVNDIKAYAD